jgi:hypothetical protein
MIVLLEGHLISKEARDLEQFDRVAITRTKLGEDADLAFSDYI